MKKIFGARAFVDLSLSIVLVGSIVMFFGFGGTIWIARQEVQAETDKSVNQSITIVQNFVDDQLQRVEDVAYTLLSSTFASTTRSESGEAFVTISQTGFVIPAEDKVFSILEQFLNSNPHVCGVAIGFEPFVYPKTKGQYGFAAYVTNVSGSNESFSLGELHDFRQREWYQGAATTDAPYWSHPFRESSHGKVVTCFSVPLHGYGNRRIGVLALDIDTESFRKKCDDVAPFPNASVTLVDSDFRFISHPDMDNLLKKISEVSMYDNYSADDSMRVKMMNHERGQYMVNRGTDHEAMFYFAPIPRTGWTISIECPSTDIYSGVKRMKRDTAIIGIFSLLFMLVCFMMMFRRLKIVTQSKAGIERDLEIASKIQMGMLPKLYPAFPDRKELDVCGFLKPAKTVGGDLYDYFIRDEKLFFCIGDVSGKGVPASLFMAVIRALFRNISLHTSDPAEILSALNIALSQGNTHNMFCTMFLGILDLKTGHLDFSNAGHNSPIIRRLADNEQGVNVHFAHPKANIALGVLENFPYVKEEAVLKPGEAIFLYTDGVTEAENATKDLFGDQATLNALAHARNHNVRSAKDFITYVYDELLAYVGDTEQSDDITMVVIEYKGQNE